MILASSALDQLIEHLVHTQGTLDRIDEALERAPHDGADHARIAEQVITHLHADWLKLDAQLSNREDWQTIERVLERTENFINALHRTVLEPRRTAVEGNLRSWLKKWAVRSTSIDPFLHTADDAQLDALSTLITESETITLPDGTVKTRFSRWLSHQISQLRVLEKKPEILEEQLRHIHDTLRAAVVLENALQTIATAIEAHTNTVTKLIGEHWLDAQRKGLNIGQVDVPDLDLDNRRKSAENTWRKLDSSLLVLRGALQLLSQDEHRLVERYVKGQGTWTSDGIDVLSALLRQIVQIRKEITGTPQLTDDGGALLAPSMEPVVQLRLLRPKLPMPAKSGTLIGYKEKLTEVRDTCTSWLKTFADVTADLQTTHARWHDLAKRRVLGDVVVALDAVNTEPDTLSQLATLHNTLVTAMATVRARLKENLTAEEQQVLEHILQLVNEGCERIDAREFADQLAYGDTLNLLVRLAEQGLIRLDIVP
jgi:hypothetical protein